MTNRWLWLCGLFAASLSVQAQTGYARDLPATASVVEVKLASCDDANVESVRVVLDGDESAPIAVAPAGTAGLWRGESDKTFDARNGVASVRYKGGRTRCVRSQAVRLETNENQWAAHFAFACLEEDVWGSLRIETGPRAFPIAYVRDVPKMQRGEVPCRERGFRRGSARIAEIASISEAVYIHFSEPVEKLHHEFYHLRVRQGEVAGKKIDAKGTTVSDVDISVDWSSRSRGAPNEADMLQRVVLDKNLRSVTLKKEQ